ncbi:insulinase family protein [Alicycliphilus denitrificans]|uniref:Peptidase M16 domain protein n=2 Tax=Alicycliphilus denitrificans TaxID=179636 RepID=F4G9H9_ALIDK|nr:pitrilysin family protein [Alicycliphilus denitrificans]ADV01168.1 peptidase M16 domain protein [Alicycliphilus denitrificans BC]AEB83394.1 peptidase M16 domain protein [Alicycliphilus denitrificans K601]QKD45316.1 insulinase family protein [Alicycliphilus denitrificans]
MNKIIKTIAARALLASVGAIFYMNNAWALLPIQHWTEPSGARVWLVESPAIPMVDVQVDFDAGARRDPAPQAGLAAAAALMSSKGVEAGGADEPALDENDLGEAWADLGASLEAGAERDGLVFSLRSLTEPDLLERAARLAARQLGQPSFAQNVWQRERARWTAAIKEADTRPGTVATKAFAAAVYGGHPYGQRPTAQTLANIEAADLQAFHARYLQACRARVSIVGALTRAQAQQLVQTLLSRLPAPPSADCAPLPAVPEVQPLEKAVQEDIPFASAQAHVLIGQPGFVRRDPDFLALLVGNHILGGGGFTSRLTNEVREKRGLSYSVGSSFSPGLNAGAFVVGLQTRPDQAAQAVRVTRDVLKRFVEEGPTEAELRAAKDNLIGGFALRIDSNRKLLANVVNIAWNGLPLDYLEHWTDRVQALTVADIRAAFQRKLQPARMVTVVVGGQP